MSFYMSPALAAILALTLVGCATTGSAPSARYSSEVDPSAAFDYNDSLEVMPVKDDDLTSKFYAKSVVEELQKKGFKFVYLEPSKGAAKTEDKDPPNDGEWWRNESVYRPKMYVIVSVAKKTSSFEYQSPDLGMVDSGVSNVNCSAYGNTVNCTSSKQKTIGVTGYSTKTGYLTAYFFTASWYPSNDESTSPVLRIFGALQSDQCTDDAAYSFLIRETIRRMQFDRPESYSYEPELPDSEACDQ